jgi:hypothetical protein
MTSRYCNLRNNSQKIVSEHFQRGILWTIFQLTRVNPFLTKYALKENDTVTQSFHQNETEKLDQMNEINRAFGAHSQLRSSHFSFTYYMINEQNYIHGFQTTISH